MKNLGIYIHIPFCKRKCYYCDFTSFANKEKFIDNYVETLKKEMAETKINVREYEVSTIYFGGGTPSYIKPNYILEILKLVKEKFNVNKNAEITIEINPGTVDEEKLKIYKKTGINRISFGLQTTNSNLLTLIGRIHTYKKFLENYNLARKIGFKNINVDLMIGLPLQKIEDVKKDLERIIKINPEHISTYSLILEEETVLEQKVSKKILDLPEEKVERKMYWEVKKTLEKYGYIHYEISNFAKENFESKHNLACWNQEEYIGFGLAAHSYVDNIRFANTNNLEEYFENYNDKTIQEKQNKEDQMKEFMMLGLRKIGGVKISDFKNKFIENPIYLYRESLSKLSIQGLIEIDQDNIKLTDKGLDLANLVWEEFV